MRLKSIKLAGFKSFVDPTTVQFPGNLNAVVGPNGCGKSNIIDAVRWVMGESSVKHLRGESSTDVIFSGSNTRKPVGMASIELIFDNSDGRLKGEYGAYSEISVRRTLSRDLQSIYYLNGTRCRRRDVQDVFLGTGMGPRSYSIIEQGMISRFIEAKPEEMRVYIEEAAGISKYKERRRETETRMRHTKENLERLKDIREELGRQLQHLQRQARAAEQYSEFKQEERGLRAELLAIRWWGLNQQYVEIEQQIAQQQNALEAAHAQQRSIETGIEKQRQAHADANESFQNVQGELYEVGSNIARHEQSIQHQKERASQLREDLTAALRSWNEANADLDSDQQRTSSLREELKSIEPELAQLHEKEQSSGREQELAEANMQQWQQAWDDFQHQASIPRQRAEVEQSKIQHLERAIAQLQQRIDKLDQEYQSLGKNPEDEAIAQLQMKSEELQERAEKQRVALNELIAGIDRQREHNQQASHQLDRARRKMQELQGRFSSLDALQQAALGQKDTQVLHWLEQNGLRKNKRLAQNVKVEKSWEVAVETVLGYHLQGVCVDNIQNLSAAFDKLNQGAVTLIDSSSGPAPSAGKGERLCDKLSSNWNLDSLLAGVLIAQDLTQALAMRSSLAAHESVVTKDGIWLGANWIRLSREVDERSHVLEREQELSELREQIAGLEEEVQAQEVDYDAGILALKNHEEARERAQQELGQVLKQHADIAAQLSAKQARLEQLTMRRQRIEHELQENREQFAAEQEQLAASREIWQQSLTAVEKDSGQREGLLAQREKFRGALDNARHQARHDKDLLHRCELRKQSIETQLQALDQGLERLHSQVEGFAQRQAMLEQAIETADAPVVELRQALERELEQRVLLEEKLAGARKVVEEVESDLSQLEQQRLKTERKVEGERAALEQHRLGWQGVKVQRETLAGQLKEMHQELDQLLEQLAEEAREDEWEAKIERIQNRIQRLGPINLAAIDEYKTQSERKTYLDAQNDDLEEALTTLENAIKKIDRETRTKFKETFDQVNKGLQEIFPKVFGGGHAYLEMTGEDLLDTGVTIMARPPGKRNSTIHLLSGGEKALTAISMVFSIFQLNPAPFCMLDEVDAPLDDANVGRFCRIVEEMSEMVQFIYITHNKITMEMASHLMGVTMHEPGVSRMVSVDIDAAAALATA